MNATKILWGQILLVSIVVLTFLWVATEWTAWRLGFQPQLGTPWFELLGLPIYRPQSFFWWWFSFDAYAPHVFDEGGYIAAAGGLAAAAVATIMSVLRAREAKRVTTYGSARWAETREIREAGLLGEDGVLLGRWRGDYLHDGPEHVLCFAPTRSGKGVGLVVPTLLTWPGSAIVQQAPMDLVDFRYLSVAVEAGDLVAVVRRHGVFPWASHFVQPPLSAIRSRSR